MPKNSKTTTSKTVKTTPSEPTAATTSEALAPAADVPELTDRQQGLLARLSSVVGISAADLATAAEISRSTAQHDLVAIEAAGLARREKGIQEGARRSPDQWFSACAIDQPGTDDATATPVKEPDAPAPAVASAAEISEPCPDAPASATATPEESEEPAPVAADPDAADDTEGASEPSEDASPTGKADTAAEESATAAEPDAADDETSIATTEPAIVKAPPTLLASEEQATERLGKGALRALVEAHLRAHPEQDFTAGQIGKALTRSSGAVANALDKLVGEGIAEQTSTSPRKFRLAPNTPAAAA
ncbi:putative transcriptional regulator [Catenulispora sp. GAS73]|uniref:hypothetical protein n=1 Tax=Catenulispora sp. GAS73 TaxID=3156269 RepID=UPI0035165AE6